MLNKIKLEISCVHCLQSSQKEIYPIINGLTDIKAKNTIMDEELFLYYCPHCGHYQKILYECVYYDPQLKYVLVMSQNSQKLLKKIELDLTGYEIRFVSDLKEMKEKIIIKENDLDDRIIEIMKHDIRTTLTSKASYDLVLENNNGLEFVLFYPDNEVIKSFVFNKEKYQEYQSQFQGLLKETVNVDEMFAAKMIYNKHKLVDYH